MNKTFLKFILLAGWFLAVPAVLAANIGFVSSNIWLSDSELLVGDQVKIYSVIVNDSDEPLTGEMVFYDNNVAIGDALSFNLGAFGASKVISTDWSATFGEHRFKAEIVNAYSINNDGSQELLDESQMSQTTEITYVDVDTDSDKLPDKKEAEKGTDPNDPDSDGDGELDGIDPNPLDARVFAGSDADGDGQSDLVDSDIDNDGLFNWEEEILGTDPKKYDTDGDGVGDKDDFYPVDPSRWEKEGDDISATIVLNDNFQENEENDNKNPKVLGITEYSQAFFAGESIFSARNIYRLSMIGFGTVVVILLMVLFINKLKRKRLEIKTDTENKKEV